MASAAAAEPLLAAADAADARAVQRLTTTAADATAESPAGLPPAGSGPAAVSTWWNRLSPTGRQLLLATRPALIGALDGVPVAVRDTANRQVLADALANTPPGGHRAGLEALAARLQRSEPARAYLIGFDPAGDGRTIVALGDPDHARHVVTNVPGAGSDLGDLRGLLARTERIATAAGDGVSSVLWLGYDAPEWLSAAGTAAAESGAAALDRFQEGLRATATGEPAHHTVVGHSYGSLVVGLAARNHDLPVEDLVLVGSPGAGANHAHDLQGPTVWASTARWDLVHATSLADRLPEWPDRNPTEDHWHGTNPTHPEFGANTFTSAPGNWQNPIDAHNAYFDEGTPSLQAIAAIARADYASIRQ